MSAATITAAAPQFITVPLTGVQICRRVPLTVPRDIADSVWAAAKQLAANPGKNPCLPLIGTFIPCDQKVENTGWIACTAHEPVFFRLLRIGTEWFIDLVIDSQNGAGKLPQNRIDCVIETGFTFFKKQHHLASFFVEANRQPKNFVGSLIMDFGNTGTSAIFSPDGARPFQVRPIFFHNPFDISEGDEEKRPRKEKSVLKSTTFLLRVPEADLADPWIVLGKSAEALIAKLDPSITSLYAPKKYVRHWPQHLKAQEPTTTFRGYLGQRMGLFPALYFVEQALHHMLELALSSLTNPHFSSRHPEFYPQFREILLTFPLTWREVDKSLFQEMVLRAASKQLVLDDKVRERFKVELVCSEPVAVAAYALWEILFQFYHLGPPGRNLQGPSLASSLFGNWEGDPKLRLLMLDIGGGSTDIALVEASWAVQEEENVDRAVNVTFRVLESLRFNRAGDRVSHIMATAIWEYLREKYKIVEALDFRVPAANPAFILQRKREIVSEITELVEKMKVHLSQGKGPWTLNSQVPDEQMLNSSLKAVIGEPIAVDLGMEVSLEVLQQWVEADRQSMQTGGEPGFMDIFFYLKDLAASLAEKKQTPHLVILSGRSSRFPFIRDFCMRYLDLPYHRIRTLGELVPDELKGQDHENMDKLAVVYGAHRFRHGNPVNFRFVAASEQEQFQRFVGTLQESPSGLRLNRILVKPKDSLPRTCKLKIPGGSSVRIGNAFRKDAAAETLATIANESAEEREVEIDLLGDYHVGMKKSPQTENVHLVEWVPGGSSEIVDNFNDTGRIDCEPDGFLRKIVLENRAEWMKVSQWPS